MTELRDMSAKELATALDNAVRELNSVFAECARRRYQVDVSFHDLTLTSMSDIDRPVHRHLRASAYKRIDEA